MKISLDSKNNTTGSKACIQPKLTVNTPGDRYEQEADAMAKLVMRKPIQQASAMSEIGMISRSIQGKGPSGEKNEKDSMPQMRKTDSGSGGFHASPGLISQLGSSNGRGTPLPFQTRSFMENAFSTDFSQVRVHTEGQAAEMSNEIQAKAFTHSQDIYFNSGEYNPQSREGKELLAHELTHTLQQEKGTIHRQMKYPKPLTDKEKTLQKYFAELSIMDELKRPFAEKVAQEYMKRYEVEVKTPAVVNQTSDKQAISTYKWEPKMSSAPSPQPYSATTYSGGLSSYAPPVFKPNEYQVTQALMYAMDMKKIGKGNTLADWKWEWKDASEKKTKDEKIDEGINQVIDEVIGNGTEKVVKKTVEYGAKFISNRLLQATVLLFPPAYEAYCLITGIFELFELIKTFSEPSGQKLTKTQEQNALIVEDVKAWMRGVEAVEEFQKNPHYSVTLSIK